MVVYGLWNALINCTSAGRDGNRNDDVRTAHFLQLEGIEMGSLDCGFINLMPNYVFENSPAFLRKQAGIYKDKGIKPEIEIFDRKNIEKEFSRLVENKLFH